MKIVNPDLYPVARDLINRMDYCRSFGPLLSPGTDAEVCTATNQLESAMHNLNAAKIDVMAALNRARTALAQAHGERVG